MHVHPDNGRLPAHVPEPLFVANPNHQKKVFTKDLRTLLSQKAAVWHGMSNLDVVRLGKNFGYMVQNLKHQSEELCVA